MHAQNMKVWFLRSNNADRCLQIKLPPIESLSLIISLHPLNTTQTAVIEYQSAFFPIPSLCPLGNPVDFTGSFFTHLFPLYASVLIIHHSKNKIIPSTAWQRGSLFSFRVMRLYQYFPNNAMLNTSINCDEWCRELNAQPSSVRLSRKQQRI